MRQADPTRRVKPAPREGETSPLARARSRQIAQCQIARKELQMDESTYRAVLVRVTGKRSLRDCDLSELEKVVAEMRRLGWRPTGSRPIARQPHVRKVYAMWTSMALLLEDASHSALCAFCKRQTGVEMPEWLDGHQANKVIEGLKAWSGRPVGGA
jgi:phage gp16-like protein